MILIIMIMIIITLMLIKNAKIICCYLSCHWNEWDFSTKKKKFVLFLSQNSKTKYLIVFGLCLYIYIHVCI